MSPTETFSWRPPAFTIAYTTFCSSLLVYGVLVAPDGSGDRRCGHTGAMRAKRTDIPGYGIGFRRSNDEGLSRCRFSGVLDPVDRGVGDRFRIRHRLVSNSLERLDNALPTALVMLVRVRRGSRDGRERRLHGGPLLGLGLGQHRDSRVLSSGRFLALATASLRLVGRLARHRRGAAVVLPLDGIGVHDEAAAVAVLAGLAEGLDETLTDPLAGHLDQPERDHLGHLVLRAVTPEALDQTPQHEVAVGLEHHVDEIDDDHAADVAQPELAHDLLGSLEVVPRHGLLERAAGAG